MNEQLIQKWNAVVKPEDTVWQLGDFCFSNIDNLKMILSRLNGNKKAVLGNHDRVIINSAPALLKEGLFAEIVDYKEIKHDGQTMCLFHYPMRRWNKQHYGSMHLWGHLHGSLEPFGKSVDVGADSTYITGQAEYRPFAYEEIRDFMRNREIIKDFGD